MAYGPADPRRRSVGRMSTTAAVAASPLAVVLVDWANVARPVRSQADVDAALERVLEASERHVLEDCPRVREVEIRLYSGWDHEDAQYVNQQLAMVEVALGSGAFEGRFAGRLYRQTVARSLLRGGPSLRGTLRYVRPNPCGACKKQIQILLCSACSSPQPPQQLEQKMVDTAIVADAVSAAGLAIALFLFSNDKDLVPGLLAAKAGGVKTVAWIRRRAVSASTTIIDPTVLTYIKVKADAQLWI